MIRINTSKILNDKLLTEFAIKILELPKYKYKAIVVDYFNNPVALMYSNKGEKIIFLNNKQKEIINKFYNMSSRERKEYMKKYLGK